MHRLFGPSRWNNEVVLGVNQLSENEKKVYAKEILDDLDLASFQDYHPMSLSGGQRQRVAIAGAIATHKDIIIFDEPTSGLDYRHMKEVVRCILKLSEEGKTQFIITHDPGKDYFHPCFTHAMVESTLG